MASARIAEALSLMEPIRLDEMDSIKLLNRIDRKFVTTEGKLLELLGMARDSYRVLNTESGPTTNYDTIYYDTDDLEMYTIHQDGHLVRTKVRVRTYLSSGETFLEIKRKNNHGRTKKKRIPAVRSDVFEPEQASFLLEKSGYDFHRLSPHVQTLFERITLVNKGLTERLTIDTHLRFHNESTGLDSGLQDAVIIELKQDGRAASQMLDMLARIGVKPFKISKYCIGTVLTDPTAKANRFKKKIRKIEKIIDKKLQ